MDLSNKVVYEKLYYFLLNTLKERKIVIMDEYSRGIGKTYNLYKMSMRKNIPMITTYAGKMYCEEQIKKQVISDLRKDYEEDDFNANIKIYSNIKELIDNKVNYVLVDEGVNIQSIIDNEIVIMTGFITEEQIDKINNKEKELSFKEQCVADLKIEAEELSKKMKSLREKGDYSMYQKLIQAYERIVGLIAKYDWQLMYSEYKVEVDGDVSNQIAVWEQNDDVMIKNHKIWEIAKIIK